MLVRTKNAITECQIHLKTTATYGTAVESYLTQHLLILLYADMQRTIYGCLDKKAEQIDEKSIREYVTSTHRNIVRDVTKSALAKFVSRFGEDAKRRFDDYLKDKDEEVSRYGNAIDKRNSVAHKQGAQITFSEIQEAVAAAEMILSAVAEALDITIT